MLKKPGKIPVQNLLSSLPGFVIHSRYKAPGNMQVKLTKEAVINFK